MNFIGSAHGIVFAGLGMRAQLTLNLDVRLSGAENYEQ